MVSENNLLLGADILLKSLETEGVEHIFGIPGGVVLPVYDAICRNTKIKHFLMKHEQAAVHAAEGYAKSSGKVGVALVTSGPGATNTVTGLADAYYDSVPIVVIAGNVSSAVLGNDAFQESDIFAITRQCTKHNFIVRNIKDLARTIKEAFYIASTGRPGPVLVDITKEAIYGKTEYIPATETALPGYNPKPELDVSSVYKVIEEIQVAEKPVILCGGGVVISNSYEELLTLSERFDIPVASTLMGLGGFPADNKNFLGFAGMHGRYWANHAITNSDLLIILGGRMSDRQTGVLKDYCPNARTIHIDIDPASLNKNLYVDLAIHAELKELLSLIIKNTEAIELTEAQKNSRKEWHKEIDAYRTEATTFKVSEDNNHPRPDELISKVYELTADDAFIATEVGQHQMWSAQLFNKNCSRRFLTSGGLGTMGFGFPAALGAQIANPDKQVVVIAGDGSFQMNLQEIATAVAYDIPVKVVIVNNGFLGMVRQWQNYMFDGRLSESKVFSPDYIKLADAYGAKGYRVDKISELDNVLKEALAQPGFAIVDCIVESQEDVLPWVPVGNANSNMLVEKK
ncbi:MAG: biosynthetic-type acetolactate synthase large subunit [bacterium]